MHRDWSPLGADRFYNLVSNGFFDGVRFFRVIPNFMAQFGINGNPAVKRRGATRSSRTIPARQSNTRGTVTFGHRQPNSRTTQVFINYKDNSFLDAQGFTPFGSRVEGMDVADKLNAEYGKGTAGKGPDRAVISRKGNKFLIKEFPEARLRQDRDNREIAIGIWQLTV